MRHYQIKYFNKGHQIILDDLRNVLPIKIDDLVALLNDVRSVRSETSEQEVHRDDNNLELIGSTTEKFRTADALAYDLTGRMRALVDFANAALAAGLRVKSE